MFEKYKKEFKEKGLEKTILTFGKDFLYGTGKAVGKSCFIVFEGFKDGLKGKEINKKDGGKKQW